MTADIIRWGGALLARLLRSPAATLAAREAMRAAAKYLVRRIQNRARDEAKRGAGKKPRIS